MSKEAQIKKSLDALKADVADAVVSATTMKAKVQHALMGCLSHWKMTGSNAGLKDLINNFIKELGNGVKGDAIVAWCMANLGMQVHADGQSLVFGTLKATDLDAKKAAEKPWYEYRKSNPFSFDLKAKIIALAKSAEKAAKTKEQEPDADVTIDDILYSQLQTMAATLAAKE